MKEISEQTIQNSIDNYKHKYRELNAINFLLKNDQKTDAIFRDKTEVEKALDILLQEVKKDIFNFIQKYRCKYPKFHYWIKKQPILTDEIAVKRKNTHQVER